MQEALPTLVLNSEASLTRAMDEPRNEQLKHPNTAGAPGFRATDEQLMLAFSKGATEAFAELFSRYKQPIYGFFRRRVAEPANAEELAQETFLALLRAGWRFLMEHSSSWHLNLGNALLVTSNLNRCKK